MTHMHNVEIVWDELMDAFASGQENRVYFLDKNTGEIFFIPTNVEDDELWRQMESNSERFLEIPAIDCSIEKQIMTRFASEVEDADLRGILRGLLNGTKPYGNIHDIISFFPEEHDRLEDIRDEFLTNRVKQWLEVNNLFTYETDAIHIPRS